MSSDKASRMSRQLSVMPRLDKLEYVAKKIKKKKKKEEKEKKREMTFGRLIVKLRYEELFVICIN